MRLEYSQGRVLIIAGSDSGGGAGLQADIKSCAAFGVYSMTVVSSVTAQNTCGVQAIVPMSTNLVDAQMQSVLSDIGADVIKIGLLSEAPIISRVADRLVDFLQQHEGFIVLDPVMVASSGDRLLAVEAVDVLAQRLVPMCHVCTPNVPEAEILTGQTIRNVENMEAAGEILLAMGAQAVLIKGGHLDGAAVTDIFMSPDQIKHFTHARIDSRHTHGTGCSLASAIAAGLALGQDLHVAVQAAREFIIKAIDTAPGFGQGKGPLNHGLNIPLRR